MAPRTVVLLGGGGAKAAAHLGAAQALQEAGIQPVRWIGTSMGGVLAASLASGNDPSMILDRFVKARRADLVVTDKPALLRGIWAKALLKPAPFRAFLEQMMTVSEFAQMKTPCTITAVESDTGRQVAFGADGETAPLLDVLMASCALPPYFPAVSVNGRSFVDGGIRSVVPLGVAEQLACDLVIAIDTGPGFDGVGVPVQSPPPLVASSDTAIGWLMAGTTELLRERWQMRTDLPRLLWLRPVKDRGATFAMDRVPTYHLAGYQAMQAALEGIQ